MTLTDHLQAGREMDAIVAEKIMGYAEPFKMHKRGDTDWVIGFRHGPEKLLGTYSSYYLEDGTKLYCDSPWAPHFPPPYSTSIEAAWTVVEHMNGLGWVADVEQRDPMSTSATFYRAEWTDEREFGVVAETAPLAICRAALDALSAASDSLPASSDAG